MKPYIVRPATMDDAHRIAPLLRQQDKVEVLAASGEMPEVVIPRAMRPPEGIVMFAETREKEPILIAGVRPFAPGVGTIWMVGTPLMEKRFGWALAREARKAVAEWHRVFPLMWNTAWAENDLHVRWLQFMGFSLLRRVQLRGFTFIEFARYKHVR